jgi:L-amino acid N-acyltransferase YncA
MMKKLIDYSHQRGTAVMTGYILARNSKMLGLASDLGFSFGPPDDSGVVRATLSLGN